MDQDEKTKEEALKAMSECASMLGRFVLFWPLLAFRALVASYLWLWFYVPVFPGAPVIGWLQFLGVLLLISFVWANPKPDTKEERERSEKEKWGWFVMKPVAYLFVWGVGYLVHLWLM